MNKRLEFKHGRRNTTLLLKRSYTEKKFTYKCLYFCFIFLLRIRTVCIKVCFYRIRVLPRAQGYEIDTQIWKVRTVFHNYIAPKCSLSHSKAMQSYPTFYYDKSSCNECEHCLTHVQPPSIAKIDYG